MAECNGLLPYRRQNAASVLPPTEWDWDIDDTPDVPYIYISLEMLPKIAPFPGDPGPHLFWAVHICDQPTRACSLFRAQGQPTVTGVLLSVDQSRGTVYLWHCVQVRSRRRLSEDSWRHFCLAFLTISYVDSYRDIDSNVTILPSLLT